jgi:PAS domain S-box-containing protein
MESVKRSAEKRIFTLVMVTLVVVAALAVFSVTSFQRLIRTDRISDQAAQTINLTEQVIKSLVDIETGTRGYIITGDESYLRPYVASSEIILPQLRSLDSLTKGNPAQHQKVVALNELIGQRLSWSQQLIEVRKESTERARQMVISGKGREITEAARALAAGIQEDQQNIFRAQNTLTSQSLKNFQYSFIGLAIAIAGLIVYLFYTINRALTARNEIEQQWHTTSKEVRNLYDRAPCGYHSLDHHGTFININQTELDWLGYSAEEVIGRLTFLDILTPASREAFKTHFPEFKEKGFIHDLEFDLVRKDGSVFPVLISATATYDQHGNYRFSLSTVFDNTQQKQNAAQLAKAAAAIFDLYNNAPCGYLSVDQTIHLSEINNTLLSWLGYTREEVIGKLKYEDLLSDESREAFIKGFEADFERYKKLGRVDDLEFYFKRKDGSTFPVIVSSNAMFNEKDEFIKSNTTVFDNTMRKQAEELLRASEGRFRSIVTSIHDALIIMDASGRVLNWNNGAERIFGWSETEMLDQPLTCIIPEKYRKQHTEGIKRYQKTREARIIGKAVELEGMKRDGTIFPIELSIGVWQIDGTPFYAGVIRDITARKHAEKLLNELAAIVEHSEDAIIGLSLDGIIQSWNKGAEKLYGYTKEEVLDRPVLSILPDNLQQEELDIMEQVRQGHSIMHYETTRVQKNGRTIGVSLTVSPVRNMTGAIVGISKIARDITDQKKKTEEILQLNAELDAFTYSVSHDLRAPVRSLSGYAQILLEDSGEKLDAEGVRVAQIIMRNAKRMGMLIDDLLNFSKLGRKKLQVTRVDMKPIVSQVIHDLLEGQPHEFIHTLDLAPAPADRALITQVWTNLISNAVKYSGKNTTPKIEIGSFDEPFQTCYYVRDNGVGFDMRYYDKLFGVFQRLHKMGDFEGTGVGLALVRKIVERHEGRVWAEGELNKGATFYFSLPKVSPESKQAEV